MTQEAGNIQDMLGESAGIVTSYLGDQVFGVPILSVNDVITHGDMTSVPLSPPEVAGLINLRGRIVTAIDMRHRFGRAVADPADDADEPGISMVVIVNGEWYSLMFDRVGEVVPVSDVVMMPMPPTVRPEIAALSFGVAKRPDELVIMLDVERILDLESGAPSKTEMLQ